MNPLAKPFPIESNDVLVLIDLQVDFFPGGALGIDGALEILDPLQRVLPLFSWRIASMDVHLPGHISLASRYENPPSGMDLWPDHCLLGTQGVRLHPRVEAWPLDLIIHKGLDIEREAYSIFEAGPQKTHHTDSFFQRLFPPQEYRLFFAGLATDYCVYSSVSDAINLSYSCFILEDACAGLSQSKERQEELALRGARLLRSSELSSNLPLQKSPLTKTT